MSERPDTYTVLTYEKIKDQNELLQGIYRETHSMNDKMFTILLMVSTALVLIFVCSLITIYAAVVFLKAIGSMP
jgi:hypothetical protein